jgi:ferredoxin-thioredoxin reductase catalytic subunit
MSIDEVEREEVEKTYLRLKEEGEAAGYLLTPDEQFARELVAGLLVNERRYGYRACPCRLPSGIKAEDLDIECPCNYRDPDLDEFGQCFCGLYVSRELAEDPYRIGSIPERRASAEPGTDGLSEKKVLAGLSHPVWRCTVCGYLCARDEAPLVCPICKARKERFRRFL